MKNILSKAFIFSILLFVSSCEDGWDFSYPFVKTVSIENYNDTSAVFKGEIVYLGDEKIIDYGYALNNGDCEFFSHKNIKNEEGEFEMYLSSVLRKGKSINIGAYAKTNDETIFGKFITYECTENVMLEIVSITPVSGDVNTVRTMVVKNLVEYYAWYVRVDNSFNKAEVTFMAPNTFEIKLHVDLEPGSHTVSISNYGFAEYPGGIIVTE